MKKIILVSLFLSFSSFFNHTELNAAEINCNSPVWKNRNRCKVKYRTKKVVEELESASEEEEIWGNFLEEMNK